MDMNQNLLCRILLMENKICKDRATRWCVTYLQDKTLLSLSFCAKRNVKYVTKAKGEN